MRTWSNKVFKGVKFIVLPNRGFDLLLSLQLLVRVDFLPQSGWGSSYLSFFFGLPPQVIIASSAFIYFMALYSISAIVFRSLLYIAKRNSPNCSPLVNAVTRILSSASLIKKASLLKRVTYDFRLSFSYCLMFSRLAENLLYLYPLIKWVTKCPLNSLKVDTMLGVNLLNHTLTSPFSVVGNALHIILFGTPCRCMRVLNDFMHWRGKDVSGVMNFDPSYASTYGILKLARKGKDVTGAMKGELIWWTSSSKLVDT